MATLAEEYDDLYEAKKEIADAITDVGEKFGIKANEADSFRSYADKILKIGNSIWSSAEDSEEQHLLITENGYYDVNDLSKRYFDDADKYSAVSSLWISVQSAPIVTGEEWIFDESENDGSYIPEDIDHQDYSSLADLCTFFGGSNGLVNLFDDWYLNVDSGAIQWIVGGTTRVSFPVSVDTNNGQKSLKTSGVAMKYADSKVKFFTVERESSLEGCIYVAAFIEEKVIIPFAYLNGFPNGYYAAIIATENGFNTGSVTSYGNYFRSKIAVFRSNADTIVCNSNNLYLGPFEQPRDSFGPKTIECDGKTLTNISGPVWIAS